MSREPRRLFAVLLIVAACALGWHYSRPPVMPRLPLGFNEWNPDFRRPFPGEKTYRRVPYANHPPDVRANAVASTQRLDGAR